MKTLILITCFSFAALFLFSCKKSGQTRPATPVITGRWNLVRDSSIFEPVGSPPENSDYVGGHVDYYDFGANGKLLWYENSQGSDSASYKISADTIITIAYFPKSSPKYSADSTVPYMITLLNANKMILTRPPIPTPGGIIIGEIMTFSR